MNKIDVERIIQSLIERDILDPSIAIMNTMSGTTEGQVYRLASHGEPKYILKIDNPDDLARVEELHTAYVDSPLLPKLHYVAPDKTFMVYAYIEGTTHYNRGSKLQWLSAVVTGLLNYYKPVEQAEVWGRFPWPRQSWNEFNEISLEDARHNQGGVLPEEDYELVKALLPSLSQVSQRLLLHGDTGVHNFVYHESALTGVIDPSPMIGPVIYDFTYAFCSSPDDLNLETLLAAFALLQLDEPIKQTRLIEEVVLQLYCRIGICVQVHPHDLEGYLEAWPYWKALLS